MRSQILGDFGAIAIGVMYKFMYTQDVKQMFCNNLFDRWIVPTEMQSCQPVFSLRENVFLVDLASCAFMYSELGCTLRLVYLYPLLLQQPQHGTTWGICDGCSSSSIL